MARAVLDMAGTGIGNIEFCFIGREGQTVRFDKIGCHRCQSAALRIKPVNIRGADLALRAFALVIGINAIGRVGEPNRAVGFHHDIIGRVEAFALIAVGQNGDRPVMFGACDPPPQMFGADQPSLPVHRIAIGVVGGLAEHADMPIATVVTHQPVVGNVGPDQAAACLKISRPFRPAASGIKRFQPDRSVDERIEPFIKIFEWRHGVYSPIFCFGN